MTYEVGLFVATDLPEVDRRGMLTLVVEPVVPCRCITADDFGEGRGDVVDEECTGRGEVDEVEVGGT